jgi:RHH-type proline utilization regulon transcriptional repressor/proline dehydrogenase/delta 1-pyrroline-5-carboxylate dehydrogenase
MTENGEMNKYVTENTAFKSFTSALNSVDSVRFNSAVESYLLNWENEFSQERDIQHIPGEQNTFRY